MLYEQINGNKRKTIYVMIGFFFLVLSIGGAVGYFLLDNYGLGIILSIFISVVYVFVTVSNSVSVIMKMNHAKEITEHDYSELRHIVEDMSMVAKVPIPRVFIIEDESPNAFATGNSPEKSAIAVTTGIIKKLNREEMEGVIGHEVSHIRNYDIRISTISLALSSAIALLVNFGMRSFFWGGGRRREENEGQLGLVMMLASVVLIILGPLAATIAQMALSRNREYLADASSVEMTRNPQGLINALKKISDSKPMKKVDHSSAAIYISDPFNHKKNFAHLFDTHPPINDRINRLSKM